MRPSNKSRSRNKSGGSNRRNVGNIVNRVFESAGPDGKVRGTPQQIIDKYQALGRDAQVSGDRVAAENYQQHAEHYARLLSEAYRQQAENRPQQPQYERDDQPYRDDGDEAPRRQQNGNGGGLTMIETGPDSESGPVETPEEAAAGKRRDEPQPPVAEQRKPNGADSGAEAAAGDEAAESAPAPKRSRSRRKPKAEAPEAEAAPQAEQASG